MLPELCSNYLIVLVLTELNTFVKKLEIGRDFISIMSMMSQMIQENEEDMNEYA